MIFGSLAKKYRAKAGMTQEDLAYEAGLSSVYVSLLERGRANPGLETVLSVSGALGVRPEKIVQELYATYRKERQPETSGSMLKQGHRV